MKALLLGAALAAALLSPVAAQQPPQNPELAIALELMARDRAQLVNVAAARLRAEAVRDDIIKERDKLRDELLARKKADEEIAKLAEQYKGQP